MKSALTPFNRHLQSSNDPRRILEYFPIDVFLRFNEYSTSNSCRDRDHYPSPQETRGWILERRGVEFVDDAIENTSNSHFSSPLFSHERINRCGMARHSRDTARFISRRHFSRVFQKRPVKISV